MFDFTQLPLAANVAIFIATAALVWFAGARITRYADAISEKAGVGHALLGLLLLAGVTSTPEIGVTVTAALAGDEKLAVNNLLGSIVMQVALLAVVDFAIGRRALTSVVPEPTIMLQGALNVAMLTIPAAAIVTGDHSLLGVGAWAWACLGGYLCSIWLLAQSQGRQPWLAVESGTGAVLPSRDRRGADEEKPLATPYLSEPLWLLLLKTAASGAAILASGYVVARTGQAMATQTGVGSSFIGFALIATSTSLPEFSTALSAARAGFLTMAISDIFGTNLLNVALIFVVDALAPGAPVLNHVGAFSVLGALLGILVTTLFMAGLAERRDRTIARMGIDSVAILLVYAGGLALLYTLR